MNKYVVIYFNKERTSSQVIRPTDKFQGDWDGLVHSVTMGNYESYKIVSE